MAIRMNTVHQTVLKSGPTAEQIAEAILKRLNRAKSEFSTEFGSEFHPNPESTDDWRPRVFQLEQFQVAATGDLQRQKMINLEFVQLGILEEGKIT